MGSENRMLSGHSRRPRRRLSAFTATALSALGLAVTAPAALAADTSPPTAPGPITVSSLTATSAKLAWTRSTDNVGIEGYRVYRGPAAAATSALTLIATTDAVTSYSATRLYRSTAYKFGVVAIDAANNKSPMTTVTLTTPGLTDTTAPSAPSSSSVTVKAFSSSRLDINWSASSSSDVAGYQVFRDGTNIATVDLPNGPRYSDNGLAAGSAHTYVIKAVDSARNVSAGTTGRAGTTLAAGAVQIARGPYLSNVTGTSAVVSWWTNLATAGAVGWGETAVSEHSVADASGSVQHHAVTITGLAPGKTYKYQVTSGSATSASTFRTAAPAGATFKFAAIGDFGGGSSGATQNGANIAGAATSFIQTVGDNIYPTSGLPDPNFSTTYSDFDQRFFKPFGAAIKSQAFFPANGNKEYYGDGQFWGAFPMLGTNHSWYSYDWGDAHILVLDSEQPFTAGTEQYNFAKSDLAGHQGAAWRIVALQRPPYSSSSANSSSKPAQTDLVPLFEQQHVQLVLSGNSHNYERSYPLTGGVQAAGGVTYVVTGAGGNGFNAFTLAQPAWSAFREATYYEYERVTVSPTSLLLEGVRADTNAVFDSATITNGATPAPAPPTNLTATPVGSNEIDLSWTASAGASGYQVSRDGGAPVSVPGTSYKDTGLTPDTSYAYSVKAVGADGTTLSTTAATVTAKTGAAPTGGGTGTALTLAPTDDATISLNNPGVNYGTAGTLTVDGGTSSTDTPSDFLLKFDIPTSCATVKAATLTLTVAGGTNNNSGKGGDFYGTGDAWSQGSVTWTGAPAKGTLVRSLGAVALNTAYTVDVTPLASGPGHVNIRVSTTSSDAAVYVSKEGSATAARPRLDVTCG
jgi:hypothetical protein